MTDRSRRRVLQAGSTLAAFALAGCGSPSTARILALGDSYTVGTGVETEDRWVTELAATIRSRGHDVPDPRIVAGSGWTTDRLSAALDDLPADATHDLVTLLVGVNDVFAGLPVAGFEETFPGLVDRAITLAGGDPQRALLMTIPDYTVTPVGRNLSTATDSRRLGRYNDVVRSTAEAAGTRLVDLLAPSREAATRPDLVAADGLHPSAAQHDLWLERIRPVAVEALGLR